MADDLATSLGTDAVAQASAVAATQPAGAPTAPSGLWVSIKNRLGAAQSAVASPVQSFGQKAATKLGASDSTASTVGAALLPVLLVVVVVVAVVAIARHSFRKPVTL